MKNKTILTLALLFVTVFANAQIKVHSDNHISIGSLNKDFGVQVNPSGYTYFSSRVNSDYTWITLATANNNTSKCWIVNRNDMTVQHRFFVDGLGFVYRVGEATLSDPSLQNFAGNIENAGEIIDQMQGYYYTFTDDDRNNSNGLQHVGISARELENVLPEAVLKDEKGVLYVNYEAITVFLIEAVKEQHEEIEFLRGKLEENGLLK